MTKAKQLTRRDFMEKTARLGAVGMVAPAIGRSVAFGQEAKAAPNDRIHVGLIGCGGMGRANLNACAQHPDVVVTGACDVWKTRRDAVVQDFKDTCRPYADYREMLQRKDIDAVIIATPPHWHALNAIAACEAGKDIYLQKPMTLHLGESLAVRNAVRKHNRVCQVGTQVHASANYRNVVELLQAGYLGKVGAVRTFNVMNQGEEGLGPDPNPQLPDGLDWDFWCGPAPLCPHHSLLAKDAYCHGSWMAYSGGWTPGMAPHIIDLPVWALDLSYPTEVSSSGGRFIIRDDGDAYDHHEVLWRYPGLTMTWMSSLTNSYGFDFHGKPERTRRLGVYFHGVNGTLYSNYGEHRIIPEGDYLNDFIKPEVAARKQAPSYVNRVLYNSGELKPIANRIPASPGHEREWLDCVKSRKQPSCNPEYHCRIDVPIVLSLLSYQLGRSIRFDPQTETIVGDKQAAELAVPTYRDPWKFPTHYLAL
jgi:predicted dehydrogenase